jgi:lysophospholipase L1-like esterase
MNLPQLFVIGDSISAYYCPFLDRYLLGRFRLAWRTGLEPNVLQGRGCDTATVLTFVRAMAADATWRPNFVLLNCGLHDLKTEPATGAKTVSLEEYSRNLRAILEALRTVGCRVIWVRTTPVDDALHHERNQVFDRFERDVTAYNAAADEIMTTAGVPMIDLHEFTLRLECELYIDHVHFTEPVSRLQAAFIAGSVLGMTICQSSTADSDELRP